ncbi:hypothetical protein ATO11_05905 [Pseudaestuariivita atlantica]|uniref:Mannosylglycerate hydrolase MGH1-like glycoside hydrolase domain-containing protein n=2 Tax=Pseudaestuariivita atlantica TaxID=1317121 RepID=A0A0L1JUI7_9RHOB|nr:hypothetical protein ATO11_05905 [Pseudaestuariivita atlantica]
MADYDALDAEARRILHLNDRGGYTVPTDGLYPYQWNWDSAFAAFGFAQFDLDRAWVELETLMTGQWASGMVPHILFHQVDDRYFPGPDVWQGVGPIPSSGITQPAVAAIFARLIYEQAPEESRDRVMALWPKLRAWHRWFMDWRTDDAGAICVTHPWEAGRDNTPEWDAPLKRIDPQGVGEYTRRDTSHVDPAMRPTKFDYDRYIWLVNLGASVGWDDAKLKAINPFRVADPTMTFILLRAHRDLLALGEALGCDTAGIADEIAVLEAGARSLWNPELRCFDARDVVTGDWAGCVSSASFLCWGAGIDDAETAAHLDRVMAKVQYGVPSHDPESPRFEPKRYWRGPSWAIMNYLIGSGLAAMGKPQADMVRDHTRAAIEHHGFAEYFDPLTGDPAGGSTFTWTAAVWLGWASPNARG